MLDLNYVLDIGISLMLSDFFYFSLFTGTGIYCRYKMFLECLVWAIGLGGGLVVIPFFTLYERKVLSYIQNRKGPKKVRILGILQPILDGVKLLIKEPSLLINLKYLMVWGGRFVTFKLMVIGWGVYPAKYVGIVLGLGLLGFLCVSSVNVYRLISCG